MTNYRKTKVNFFKNTTKNFYRREFSRDKLTTKQGEPGRDRDEDDHVKCYRIKTSMGMRQLGKGVPNASFSQTTYSKFYQSAQDPQN